MGKKYIIELKKNETLYKAATRESDGTAYVCSAIGTPCTEPDLEQVREEAYEKGKMDAYVEDSKNITVLKEEAEEAYQRGLNDAWEAARKIVDLWRDIPNDELMKIFDVRGGWGESVLSLIMRCLPPSEAIEKIRQYEQEKEKDGLRQNIQTIVDQCGYTLDEIAEVLQEMKES